MTRSLKKKITTQILNSVSGEVDKKMYKYLLIIIVYNLFIYVIVTSGRRWGRAGAQRTREYGIKTAAGDRPTETSPRATRGSAGCASRRSGKSSIRTSIHPSI